MNPEIVAMTLGRLMAGSERLNDELTIILSAIHFLSQSPVGTSPLDRYMTDELKMAARRCAWTVFDQHILITKQLKALR